MTNAENMIMADAIETAIKAERENIILKRATKVMLFCIVVLSVALVLTCWR